LGRRGGARHDSSRPDGQWRCGNRPEEGDEGGVGRVGCKGRVGWMTGWAGFGNGKRKWKNGVGLGCEGRLGRSQIGLLRKIENCFLNLCFKEMGFKSKVLNISKPNLYYIQNRIKSNQLFGTFSNLEIDLNNQIQINTLNGGLLNWLRKIFRSKV
jgi:hypothetical protein